MLENFLNAIGLSDGDSQDNMEQGIDGQWVDTDGDGIYDSFLTDMDGDGIYESLLTDSDGDGIYESLFTDSDGDGVFDTLAMDLETDVDGDGVTDFIIFSEDIHGESVFDTVTQWEEREENGSLFFSESTDAEAYNIYNHFTPEESDGVGITGNPGEAVESWHLQSGNTCAVVSQEFVLESIFNREFDEQELREIAEDNGWYDNGTNIEDVGKILEYYGANVEQSTGNSLDDLKSSLADGNQIIAGVDADELWSGQNEEMFGPGMDANHAIQVIGFDESDPSNPMVIINDSGVSNGQGVMIPAEEFMDAWEDSGCFMVEAS